ncbi:EAL domain-containing protein [Cellulomonas sp. C5510]|uniref:EAL domain-containing protein n=1 Tax=Cellulomonas sp. C5510 TaxID=2871170 RepID=UPI001C94583D|nr:EAL domain-containing protein [Cellulomonas sp. C5510]QZN85437.1 EAL domain-containing protein [Cellulomonas sp. C5510]
MRDPGVGPASWTDALIAERTASTLFDPVTGTLSLRGARGRLREGRRTHVTAVVVARLPRSRRPAGRFSRLDQDDRSLSRILIPWASGLGAPVTWIADGVAAVGVETPERSARDTERIRAAVHDLDVTLRHAFDDSPLTSVSSGPGDAPSEVLGRAVAALVRRAGSLTGPADPGRIPTQRRRGELRDAGTGELLGREIHLHPRAGTLLGRDCDPLLTAITRAPAVLGAAERLRARCPQWSPVTRLEHPLLVDVTALLALRTGDAARVDTLLDSLPAGAHLGVDAWAAAQLPFLHPAMQAARRRGRTVVLTQYGSGREPVTPLDELPVDAISLDPALERGAVTSRADRAVRWALLETARRHDVLVLSHLDRDTLSLLAPVAPRRTDVPQPGPVRQVLDDAWVAGLTPAETALMINAGRVEQPGRRRWDRYQVSLAWAGLRHHGTAGW